MSRRHRVLFSCRDPGGAGNIVAVVEAFRKDGRFQVDVAASGAALDILRRAGESPRRFALSDGSDTVWDREDGADLTNAAERLLRETEPDIVFVALSSQGVGVDEALLAAASVPTFAVQDFWGDVNPAMGVVADLYFVLDAAAETLTRERWSADAVAVGSPKHAKYAALDVDEMRRSGRTAIGASGDDRVLGFFGQSPEVPGHEDTYRALVDAVTKLVPRPVLLLREHPKYHTPEKRREHIDLARANGLQAVDVTDKGGAEMWLASCDVATTLFSVSGLDHAYLSAHSREPIGSMLYLLPNSAIRNYALDACGIQQFPIVDRGIGQVVTSVAEIPLGLERAMSRECAVAYFRASKTLALQDPCGKIIDVVMQRITGGGADMPGPARLPAADGLSPTLVDGAGPGAQAPGEVEGIHARRGRR